MRRSFLPALLGAAALARAGGARAHDPGDPEAHRSMPHQVTAGVTPLCSEHLSGRHDAVAEDGDGLFAADGVPCVGVSIGFARELGRSFELRLRASYDKPFPSNEALYESLHELRVSVSPALVAYRLRDRLTITLGPEVGVFGAFLVDREIEGPPARRLEATEAAGWLVGLSAAVRPWVTYHTGFFAELGAGAAGVSTDELELRSGWLGRVTVGWADRF